MPRVEVKGEVDTDRLPPAEISQPISLDDSFLGLIVKSRLRSGSHGEGS
jgi:hypothetical protein